MSLRVWRTRSPLEPAFEAAWRRRMSRTPHAHFAFDLQYLNHEADEGRPATAVLIDEDRLRGAMVLRDTPAGYECGWPWRWHAVVEDAPEGMATGLSPADAEALAAYASSVAKGTRLHLYLPRTSGSATSYRAGATVIQDLGLSEEVMWNNLTDSKRRMVKRARSRGYEIVEATTHELFRQFAAIQETTFARQGYSFDVNQVTHFQPGFGEAWREWELPWMWLLVALKEGEVEAGSGFGVLEGGSVDYRTNASSEVARRDGVNVLLNWEAMRRARERGYRWLNWCGIRRFKREFGGQQIEIDCRLGGGPLWFFPNLVTAAVRATRNSAIAWRHQRSERAQSPEGPAVSPRSGDRSLNAKAG